MTSNGDPPLNATSSSAGNAGDRLHSPRSPRQPASKAASPSAKENHPLPQNGTHDNDDVQNESEAETVVLGSRDNDSPQKKLIKTERDDDNDLTRLRLIKEQSQSHSPKSNGRRRSSNSNSKDVHLNGAGHGESPVPTSPSSRTTSRHTKDTSPTDSTKSPVQSALSPRTAHSPQTGDNRKRKSRDDSLAKSIEPPRQKARTEGLSLKESPTTPAFGRPHKRSQSTQSAVTGVAGRKRRDVSALNVSTERWSDDSSDSSSPHTTHTPGYLQHTRGKRGSRRTPASPARAMAKSKTDRFGATRLARESEKGDLDAVKEALEEAPDELNQVDYAGIAPLQKAALHGWEDVVGYLISKGCNTECESGNRDTPLIDAVENGHLEVVKLLLNQGKVNPHHSNKKGQRAIDVLNYEHDDVEDIEKELRAAMRRQTNRTNNKQEQTGRKEARTASRLLYNEFNVETLIEKAGDGDILAVGELINSNIRPNITCGVAAARGGHYDILSILLASGLKADPDPSKHPETPMTVAIGRGHLDVIQLLLEQDNFDPTRRNKEGKAYYEMAEEKAGPRWEQERDVLKQAFDDHKGSHRSPRRVKKEPPHLSAIRMQRRKSLKPERSSSPRPEAKRAHLTKSSTVPASTVPAPPQKSRRLMTGKEIAHREGKRRKRVVDEDESSEEESEEDVRPPTRKVKPRSYSEGEETKPIKKPLKVRSDDNDTVKRKVRARSDESGDDHGSKPPSKIRKKLDTPLSAKPTPEIESPDERKPARKNIHFRTVGEKFRKRKLSDASTENGGLKKTPTASAKSTPAPPERIATPEVMREKRQEEERLAAEAKQRAAEAAAEAEARRMEEEQMARKFAEEQAAQRKVEAEIEAQRQAREAEAARLREEEAAQRRIEEEAKRQEMLLARQDRISRLPKALRRACELGTNRPLHFSGEELGISAVFLPLFYATSQDLQDPATLPNQTYICSFQAVGILGLSELDLAHLESPYSEWPRIPVTRQQRDAILRQYDVALLAQDFRFPMEGTPEFDYHKMQESIKEAKHQFLTMEGLYWVEDVLLQREVEGSEALQPLLSDIKSDCKRRRIHLDVNSDSTPEKVHRPRKSFMDMVLAQNGAHGVNGIATQVNGEAG